MHIGIIVIGRNEGERLRRCLASVAGQAESVVYVDSGSEDGSVALAASMGATVVELDRTRPFTAARARNAGVEKLRAMDPDVDRVHFIDGDCELAPGWLERASVALDAESAVAVVCGRLRERHPEVSIYNRLCDSEWNIPVGYANTSGGNAMMRIEAFNAVGGFNPELIAGEEPDLCLRLRQRGHRVLRIDAEMGTHDANLTRFSQWWRRTVRAGHFYAEAYARHRGEPGHDFGRKVFRHFCWGMLLPLFVLALLWPTRGFSLLLLLGYLVSGWRSYRSARRRGMDRENARIDAFYSVLSKFALAYGQLRYWVMACLGRRSELIEYRRGRGGAKSAGPL